MSDLKRWEPENEKFWEKRRKNALRTENLWISIPSLLCGFAVWDVLSIITFR